MLIQWYSEVLRLKVEIWGVIKKNYDSGVEEGGGVGVGQKRIHNWRKDSRRKGLRLVGSIRSWSWRFGVLRIRLFWEGMIKKRGVREGINNVKVLAKPRLD